MKILTLTDQNINNYNNGKGDKNLIIFDLHYYFEQCTIKDNMLNIDNNFLDLTNIKTVIFNYNEDRLSKLYNNNTIKNDIIYKIANLINNKYKHITIYNDPLKCFILGNKLETYSKIKDISNSIFKIPKFIKINCINDLKNIDFFPIIIKYYINGATLDTICKNYNEVLEIYNKKFNNKNNIMCVEYINSYIKELNTNNSIRFFIINNKIIDFYFRCSNKWNIHTQDSNLTLFKYSNEFFKEFFKKNYLLIENYINNLHKIFDNGFFVFDIILNNNKLYICEGGLKIFDYLKTNNINLNKISLDKIKLRKLYEKIILEL